MIPAVPHTARNPLLAWIDQHHGVAHTSQLLIAGYTHREMRQSVFDGQLERVRRSWLVRPTADPRRRAAATVGGRATCMSAAGLQGLWVPDHAETHVAVMATASRNAVDGIRLHWASGPAPVTRTITEEPIVNALFHVARCAPLHDALAVWESAIRIGKAQSEMLLRVAWRSSAAARLAQIAGELSDSGMETRFVRGMHEVGITVRQQVRLDGRPVDGLIGEALVVQLDGFEFHRSAADRRRDIGADARLVLLGYTVLRFDYAQIFVHWDEVVATVRMAIAQGLHRHGNR
jgi:very-short-patch-repair endonuclease